MRILLSAAMIAIAPMATAGEETAALNPVAVAEAPTVNRFLVRAPIADPGETVHVGDILTVTRGFETWSLGCSVRLSSGRRSCSIEQVVLDSARPVGARSSVRWGVGSNAANKSVLFVQVTSNFSVEAGMTISFTGVEKRIPQQEWYCSEQGCIIAIPFEGILQSAVLSSQEIGFAYKVKSPDADYIDVQLRGDMSGFEKALEIAATNPFAPIEQPKKQAAQPQKADTKKIPAAKPAPVAKKKEPTGTQDEAKNAPARPKDSGLF